MVLQNIISRNVPTEWMAHQNEISQIFICQLWECLSPFLQVLDKVINRFLWSNCVLMVVLRATWSPHANYVCDDDMELLRKAFEYLVVQRAWSSVPMNENENGFVWAMPQVYQLCADVDRLAVIIIDTDIQRLDEIHRNTRELKDLSLSSVQIWVTK